MVITLGTSFFSTQMLVVLLDCHGSSFGEDLLQTGEKRGECWGLLGLAGACWDDRKIISGWWARGKTPS